MFYFEKNIYTYKICIQKQHIRFQHQVSYTKSVSEVCKNINDTSDMSVIRLALMRMRKLYPLSNAEPENGFII